MEARLQAATIKLTGRDRVMLIRNLVENDIIKNIVVSQKDYKNGDVLESSFAIRIF